VTVRAGLRAAVGFAALAAAAAGAQSPDDPLPPGARLPTAALRAPDAALALPSTALAFPAVDVALPVVALVLPAADLAAPKPAIEIKQTKTEVRLELAADALFDFDKADLKPAAQETLQKVAEFVRENARGAVRIEGHTDGKGGDAYNQKLSERRAASVRDWLAKNAGAKGVTYQTQGFGAKRPVAPNAKPDGSDDPEGRQKNRRVELVIKR
jgi:outer membrane protein OmpA-like peptidoglycan-associated protein